VTWRTKPRPGRIPKTLRELPVGQEVLFRFDENLAPPGKLWERVSYYLSREKARAARAEGLTARNDKKLFVRAVVENVGISVTRTR
jgi:hypothetical protein